MTRFITSKRADLNGLQLDIVSEIQEDTPRIEYELILDTYPIDYADSHYVIDKFNILYSINEQFEVQKLRDTVEFLLWYKNRDYSWRLDNPLTTCCSELNDRWDCNIFEGYPCYTNKYGESVSNFLDSFQIYYWDKEGKCYNVDVIIPEKMTKSWG